MICFPLKVAQLWGWALFALDSNDVHHPERAGWQPDDHRFTNFRHLRGWPEGQHCSDLLRLADPMDGNAASSISAECRFPAAPEV
jgi:hypothetical protein